MNSHLPKRAVLSYALPALPLAIPTVAVYILLPTFYVEEVGMSLGMVGLLLVLARVLDVISDPLIGRWLDHVQGKLFKLTFVAGGLLCIPGLWLLIHPDPSTAAISLFAGSALLYLGWTLIQIPYITWITHLSSDSFQRSRAISYREGFSLLGLLLSACLPLLALMGFSTQAVLQSMMLVTVLLGAFFLYRLLSDLPTPSYLKMAQGRWHDIKNNRLAVRLIAAWLLNGIANGIPAVLFPLYITSVLGNSPDARGVFILIYFIAACCSLPLWLYLSRRFDKVLLWSVAMILAICAFIPAVFLAPGDNHAFVLICILTGFAFGADLSLPHAIQAEVADWDKFRFKREHTGLLFALWNAATKAALALAALFALGLLELSGFDAQSATPSLSLALIYALLPCVFKSMSILILWRFPLRNHHHRALIRRLNERTSGSLHHAGSLTKPVLSSATHGRVQ